MNKETLSDLGFSDGEDSQVAKTEKRDEAPNEEKLQKLEELKAFKEKYERRGVCYISRIPPYMKVSFLRGLLQPYGIERIYLVPESKKLFGHMFSLPLLCSRWGSGERGVSETENGGPAPYGFPIRIYISGFIRAAGN